MPVETHMRKDDLGGVCEVAQNHWRAFVHGAGRVRGA